MLDTEIVCASSACAPPSKKVWSSKALHGGMTEAAPVLLTVWEPTANAKAADEE